MRPLIMITNDDGIYSPGLQAAAEAVCDLGEILISAPITQQTGMGRAFPRTNDLGIIEEIGLDLKGKAVTGYGVHGSPAYAAAHGILELAKRPPDLCISGINYGENVGMILTCSGTLGAAFEAVSHGIPAIAVSLQTDLEHQRSNAYQEADWSLSKQVVREWTLKFIEEGMPKGADILNINIPDRPDLGLEQRFTRCSRQNYFEFQKPGQRDLGMPYELKSKCIVDLKKLEENSDIYAIYVDKVVSVTPLTWDMSLPVSQPSRILT